MDDPAAQRQSFGDLPLTRTRVAGNDKNC